MNCVTSSTCQTRAVELVECSSGILTESRDAKHRVVQGNQLRYRNQPNGDLLRDFSLPVVETLPQNTGTHPLEWI